MMVGLWRHGCGSGRRSRRRAVVWTALVVALAALSAGAVIASASGSPTSVTEPALNIGRTSVTLEGTVNPHGTNVTECVFRYGTTPALGSSIPCSYLPGHGVTPVPVEVTLTGLPETTTFYYKVFAKDSEGESLGAERTFTTLPTAPHSTIKQPQQVTHTSATFEGLVTPNESEVTECFFEYGTVPGSLDHTVACSPSPGSGTAPVPVSGHVTGLSESTIYYYRLVSQNAFGTDTSPREQAFTLPNQPDVSAETANPVGNTTATLKGKVDPRAALVEECVFEWGTSTSYGETAPCSPTPGSGEEHVEVTAELEGLSPSTAYDFRLSAKNVFGQSASGNRTFTTEPTLPKAFVHKNNEVAARSAVLKGTVNLEGANLTECFFEYGTTPAFGQEVPCTTVPAREGFVKATARVNGLSPTTTYVFRLVATNAFGTDYSAEERFTTFATGMLPAITKVAPKKGAPSGGNVVKIKGVNLLEAETVRFGGVEAESVTDETTESVSAVAPPGAGLVDVTVTTPDGTSEVSASDHYTYGPPSITAVSPGSGPIAGGNEVTVTGAGFVPGVEQSTFIFGKAAATSVVCFTLNECTMTVPAEPKGRPKTVKVKAIVSGVKSKGSPGAVYSYTP